MSAHPKATATLLEGLSLFMGERVCVVLCVDDRSSSSASLGLLDALGTSERSVFYDVGVATRLPRRERRKAADAVRLQGAYFRDLRQLGWGVGVMTIDRETEVEIRRLHFGEHWKKGTIAAQLGVHHEVVERLVGPWSPSLCRSEPRPTVLDPYRGLVLETLERFPRVGSTRIYDMLVERGYAGSERSLRRFVSLHRPVVPQEVYLRLERLAGE